MDAGAGEEEPGRWICEGGGGTDGPAMAGAGGGEDEPGRWIREEGGGADGPAADPAMAVADGGEEWRSFRAGGGEGRRSLCAGGEEEQPGQRPLPGGGEEEPAERDLCPGSVTSSGPVQPRRGDASLRRRSPDPAGAGLVRDGSAEARWEGASKSGREQWLRDRLQSLKRLSGTTFES